MGALITKTDEILNKIIDAGSDAFQNLFELYVEPNPMEEGSSNDLSPLSYRITTFVAPKRSSTSVALPYQGTVINLPSPGSDINNIQEITFRVDSNYKLYSTLKDRLLITPQGYISFNKDKMIPKITVNSLTPINDGTLKKSYSWEFVDCYILGLSPITMSYDNASSIISVLTFSYKEVYEKYIMNQNNQLSQDSSQDDTVETPMGGDQKLTIFKRNSSIKTMTSLN